MARGCRGFQHPEQRIAQKIKSKSKLVLSMLVTTWLSNIGFHLQLIWLRLAANFGSDWFRIMQDIVPSFWVQPSEVSMLLYSNLSTCPFLGRDVNLDLLLCTGLYLEHSALFLYHIFTRKPMNDRKIERSYGRCSGRQQLLANSIENFILHVEKKSDPLRPEI